MAETIFTIGHSNHPIDGFIALLKRHEITAVCDVRSQPYSRMNPQFNREALSADLKAHDIRYVFLGKELGARTEDRSCYVGGQVQYDLLAQTSMFRSGITRVLEGAKKYRIALMCAEKDPLECHRTILVGRSLAAQGAQINHILPDGSVEDSSHATQRLITRWRIPERDMFREVDPVSEAYARQANQIAYRVDSTGVMRNGSAASEAWEK